MLLELGIKVVPQRQVEYRQITKEHSRFKFEKVKISNNISKD